MALSAIVAPHDRQVMKSTYCIRVLIPISDVIPSRTTPWATWTLIALNVAGVLTAAIEMPWLALVANVLALVLFGENLEAHLGRGRFLAFYVAGGAVAALIAARVTSPGAWTVVGPGGAAATLLGGYLAMFPYSRVLVLVYLVLFVDVVEVPATFFLGLWFIVQAAATITGPVSPVADGVVFMAHLGAFAFGLAAIWLVRRPIRWE